MNGLWLPSSRIVRQGLPQLGATVAGATAIALTTVANASAATALVLLLILMLVAARSAGQALLLLVLVAPWTNLANVLVGGRYTAVGLDVFVISLAGALPLCFPAFRPADRAVKAAVLSVLACVLVGLLEILNPKGLALLGGMEGFRAFALPLLGVPIGLLVAAHDARLPRQLVVVLIATASLVAVMGLRQVAFMSAIDEQIVRNAKSDLLVFMMTGTHTFRAFSPLPGPFHFGAIMMLGLTCAVALFLERVRLTRLPIILLLLAALAFNATRLNWGGTVAALGLVFLLSLSRERLGVWLRTLAVIAALVFALTIALSRAQSLTLLQRFAGSFFSNPTENTSYVYRVLAWTHDIIPAIRRSPLFGYGTGVAKDGLGRYSSHNTFFKVLLEGGALLFLPYVLFLGAAAIALFRRRMWLTARVGLAVLVGMHVAGMFGPMIDAYPANLFTWLLVGCALGQCDSQERSGAISRHHARAELQHSQGASQPA